VACAAAATEQNDESPLPKEQFSVSCPHSFPVPAEDLQPGPEFKETCDKKDDAKWKAFYKLQALS